MRTETSIKSLVTHRQQEPPACCYFSNTTACSCKAYSKLAKMTSTLNSSFNQSSKTIVTWSSNGKIIFTPISVVLIFDAGCPAHTTYNSFLTPLYSLIQELEES